MFGLQKKQKIIEYKSQFRFPQNGLKKSLFIHMAAVMFVSSPASAEWKLILNKCRELLTSYHSSISLDEMVNFNPETQFEFELTGLSNYGVEKRRKEDLIEYERTKLGLRHLESDSERFPYRIFIYKGRIYKSNGTLLSSDKMSMGLSYVMDKKGAFYAGNLHHPAYLKFEPVAGAGHIVVRNGRLISVDRSSGQYAPKRLHLRQVEERFRELGLDVSDVIFEYDSSLFD